MTFGQDLVRLKICLSRIEFYLGSITCLMKRLSLTSSPSKPISLLEVKRLALYCVTVNSVGGIIDCIY